MIGVIAVLALLLGAAFHFGMLGLGRWLAGLPFGERSLRDAVAWRDAPAAARSLLFARAGGGVFGWYLAAALVSTLGVAITGETRVDDASMRVTVAGGGPADVAGLRDGDRIVAVDGAPVTTWDELRSRVRTTEPVKVDVDRAGQAMTFEVVPKGAPPKILVGPHVERRDAGAGGALATGFATPFVVVGTTARGFARILFGSEKPELVGPVGIVRETEAAQRRSGIGTTLRLVGALGSYVLPVLAFALLLSTIRSRRAAPPPA